MRCTHAEKLIPLFAGDDLPARKADALRRHLESCAKCRRLAAEFEESHEWLRGFAAPQFDESMLDGMRDSVLRDIGRIENRSRWIQWIVPRWNLKFMAVLSMSLLIVFAAAYAYRGRQRQPVTDKKDIVITTPGRDSIGGAQGNNEGFKVNPSPVPTRLPLRKRPRGIIENHGVKPVQSPDRVIAQISPPPPPINIEPAFEPPIGDPAKDDAIFNREMTRIEFQTADPNIRIIWLTPKDSNSSSTKPGVNSR
jgi:hypothetical protein